MKYRLPAPGLIDELVEHPAFAGPVRHIVEVVDPGLDFHKIDLINPVRPDSDSLLGEFLGSDSKLPRRRVRRRIRGGRVLLEVRQMMKSGDWAAARPAHFVAAYAVMHREVYGAETAELATPKDWGKGIGIVTRLLRGAFAGKVLALADYHWWLWDRERRRREQAVVRGRQPGHVGLGLAFSARLVSEWRAAGGK